MGLFSRGVGGSNITGGNLTLSGIATALQFVSTQVANSVGFLLNTAGARLKFSSGGTTDYMSSDGVDTITAAGAFKATTGVIAAHNNGSNNLQLLNNGNAQKFYFSINGTTLNIYNNAASVTLMSFTDAGLMSVPTTDTTGTPGSATANTPSGKSSIAIGASSCVISNNLITTASRVFISPRARDATALLPAVTAQVNGTSFTVSTVGNATAALPFDWWVVG